MQKNQYYRSAIVGIFAVLGITLITFLLIIAKKGARMVSSMLSNVNTPTQPQNGTNPIAPPTTNELPPGEFIVIPIPSGEYNITSISKNLFLTAAPFNGPINIFINPLRGSQGRSITITNARPPPSSNIVVTGKAGVQIDSDTGNIKVVPGNRVVLVAIRDDQYILKSSLI